MPIQADSDSLDPALAWLPSFLKVSANQLAALALLGHHITQAESLSGAHVVSTRNSPSNCACGQHLVNCSFTSMAAFVCLWEFLILAVKRQKKKEQWQNNSFQKQLFPNFSIVCPARQDFVAVLNHCMRPNMPVIFEIGYLNISNEVKKTVEFLLEIQ